MSSHASQEYHPEIYWSDVAKRTSQRKDGIIAGDDEPFYRYKRLKFLQQLHQINFTDKKILEIGPGPGGNLSEIWKHNPLELVGADISSDMIDYARSHLSPEINLIKINGIDLPFSQDYFDITLTVTVLQHNTNENMLKQLLSSICRCTKGEIYLFERIEKTVKGTSLNMGRPISYYEKIMKEHEFELQSINFLNVAASYYMAGMTRKLLNSPHRQEAEPLSSISLAIQRLLLPITKSIDPLINSQREFAQLKFKKKHIDATS